jgi:hypothetical protein
MQAYVSRRSVLGTDQQGRLRSLRNDHVMRSQWTIEMGQSRRSDTDCPEALARVKASRRGRRFAALTRASRFRSTGIYRSVGRVSPLQKIEFDHVPAGRDPDIAAQDRVRF